MKGLYSLLLALISVTSSQGIESPTVSLQMGDGSIHSSDLLIFTCPPKAELLGKKVEYRVYQTEDLETWTPSNAYAIVRLRFDNEYVITFVKDDPSQGIFTNGQYFQMVDGSAITFSMREITGTTQTFPSGPELINYADRKEVNFFKIEYEVFEDDGPIIVEPIGVSNG
ncbi:MAG: hypothetical protein ACSHX4_07755 [Opitutaceae bacterium]